MARGKSTTSAIASETPRASQKEQHSKNFKCVSQGHSSQRAKIKQMWRNLYDNRIRQCAVTICSYAMTMSYSTLKRVQTIKRFMLLRFAAFRRVGRSDVRHIGAKLSTLFLHVFHRATNRQLNASSRWRIGGICQTRGRRIECAGKDACVCRRKTA